MGSTGRGVYLDFRDAIESKGAETIAPGPRVALATSALRAGKHVLSEKPLGLTRPSVESVVDLAAELNLCLYVAPFVHLSPTFRDLWTRVHRGDIGRVHTARAMYGNLGTDWARWANDSNMGPLAEIGVYNLKSLVLLLGPVTSVTAAETVAIPTVGSDPALPGSPDVIHAILDHESGALSSIVSSFAVHASHRPAIELYGVEGSANLLGDDWDPAGFEIWRADAGHWELHEPPDSTWLWTDGLRELVTALRENRDPLGSPDIDLHVLDVVTACKRSARTRQAGTVRIAPCHPGPDLGDLAIEGP